MNVPKAVEIKAFVPAKDFNLAKEFYIQLGFELIWEDEKLAQFRMGNSQFFLQNFYIKEFADNYMIYLLVEDIDEWWQHIQTSGLADKYEITVKPPHDYPWGMREIHLIDPSGVFWHFGQQVNSKE